MDALLGWRLGENEADFRTVGLLLSNCAVVQLEKDHGTRLDQLRFAGSQVERNASRRVSLQIFTFGSRMELVARQPARQRGLGCFDGAPVDRLGVEKFADFPFQRWPVSWDCVSLHVMYDRPISRTDLSRLNPFILREIGRDRDVLIWN